jgi:hypothetical protein
VGEAKGFAETIQLTNALKPDVLLMDLHMSDEHEYSPESVRVQLLCGHAAGHLKQGLLYASSAGAVRRIDFRFARKSKTGESKSKRRLE